MCYRDDETNLVSKQQNVGLSANASLIKLV